MMPLAANMRVTAAAPLDNREVVENFEDLINPDTFGNYAFVGMLVYVVATEEHYVLTEQDENNPSDTSQWKWKKICETDVIDI